MFSKIAWVCGGGWRAGLWMGAASCLLALSPAHAQLAPDWSTSVVAQGQPPVLAVDGGGNSLLGVTLAGQPVTVYKLGPQGGPIWQRSLTAAGSASRVLDAVADASGNTLLGGAVLDAAGMPAGTLVAKLDAAGNPLWQQVGATAAQVRELALDASGNVYALVQAGTASTGTDLQLAKFGASGTLLWTRSVGAPLASGIDSLVLNSAGQPVVSGTNSAGQALIAAFDALGNPLASINTGTSALSLAAGRNGEVYAVGSSGAGILAIKFGPAFNELWRSSLTTGGGALRAAVDAAGNLVMAGAFILPSSGGGFGATVITYNWRTVKLSSAGATLWSADFGYPHFVMGSPAALGLGIDGSVYVTGRSAEPVTSATGSVSYRPSMTTLKYTGAGALAGTVYTNVSQVGTDLKVAGDGGVSVVGEANVLSGSSAAPVLHFAAPVLAPARPSALLVTGPVWESSGATAMVTVSSAAGATVKLSSSNTSAARVPLTVVVPAGATTATFPITTLAVRRNTAVAIKASANGTTLSTSITVLNR